MTLEKKYTKRYCTFHIPENTFCKQPGYLTKQYNKNITLSDVMRFVTRNRTEYVVLNAAIDCRLQSNQKSSLSSQTMYYAIWIGIYLSNFRLMLFVHRHIMCVERAQCTSVAPTGYAQKTFVQYIQTQIR